MSNKAVVSLNTGLEDAETVTIALLVAVGAAEAGRPTLMFLTKEAGTPCTRRGCCWVRVRRLPADPGPVEQVSGGLWQVAGVPGLFQLQATRYCIAD